ncbi:MAG: GlsB/YeaQ/YmgE family stress response membrane protein [Janthinobacterium lividum]
MNFILWLVVGGVAGWLAGLIMRDQGGILINIVVGIVGAAIAGFIFGGGADLNQALTIQSFIYSVIGAVILLAIVNLVRRGRVR